MAKKKKKCTGYVYLGTDETGKEIRKYCSATTPLGLERKKIELRRKYATGELSINTALVRVIADKWLETKEMLSPKTYKMYADTVRLHINPIIGHMKTHTVKPMHCQECINAMSDHRRSCEVISTTLNQIFKYARRNLFCSDNPAEYIILPEDKSNPRRCLNDIEKATLAKAELDLEEQCIIGLMMRCGLANNELTATRKHLINPNDRKIAIEGVVMLGRRPGEDAYRAFPKRRSRIRRVPVPDDFWPILVSFAQDKDDFLFISGNGDLFTEQVFQTRWKSIQRKWKKVAGGTVGDDVTPYLLRHEYASELLRQGYTIPEAQYLMGHSSPKMLLEVYAHIEAEKITAEKLNKSEDNLSHFISRTL